LEALDAKTCGDAKQIPGIARDLDITARKFCLAPTLSTPIVDALRKAHLQPSLDKLAGKVKGWRKGCFSFDARLLLVKHVLTAMTIFQLLVIDPPIWLVKAIDRLRRGFLWNNDEIAQGGKCLVSWASVCRPIEFGGLGNLDLLALRVRWLWQQWTETEKSWQGLPIAVDSRAGALFNAAVQFFLGNGLWISFWHDPWFEGRSIAPSHPRCSNTTLKGTSC
jgi:hypothetical protein